MRNQLLFLRRSLGRKRLSWAVTMIDQSTFVEELLTVKFWLNTYVLFLRNEIKSESCFLWKYWALQISGCCFFYIVFSKILKHAIILLFWTIVARCSWSFVHEFMLVNSIQSIYDVDMFHSSWTSLPLSYHTDIVLL